MTKKTKASKGIQSPLKARKSHLPESACHGFLQKVRHVKFCFTFNLRNKDLTWVTVGVEISDKY